MPDPVDQPASVGLRSRMLRGAFFEIGGYGAQQVIRLGSSLVLTRLLFPAAFGLSSMVGVIATGLVLLSDLAISPCVIQSKRGDDIAFLNTAFTIQAIRGVALGAVMLILAKPAAWFYHEPQIQGMLCLGSAQLAISGLHSTSVFTLRRKLSLGWVNGLEFTQMVFSTAVTITLALLYPSAWALVIGGASGTVFFVVATHFLPVSYRNRFHLEKESSLEIRRFGRWILGSSAATFFGSQGDRILLGRLLGAKWLGIYSVAINLSEAISAVVTRVINGVMYPVLSQAGRESGSNISRLYYRMRLRLDLFSMVSTGLVAGTGPWIVRTLWDPRYSEAGWILQALCVRLAVAFVVVPNEISLFSLGHTRYVFYRSITRLLGTFLFIPAGWYFAGVRGVIWGAVAAELPTIFAVWPKSRRLGILRIRREILAIGLFVTAFGLGHWLSPWLPAVHLR